MSNVMHKIVVREIDRYKSQLHKDKVESEYAIYFKLKEGISLECHTVIGEKAKKDLVNELILTHFVSQNNNNKIDVEDIIEESSVFIPNPWTNTTHLS